MWGLGDTYLSVVRHSCDIRSVELNGGTIRGEVECETVQADEDCRTRMLESNEKGEKSMAKLKCDSWWGLGHAKPLPPNLVNHNVDGTIARSAPPAPLTGLLFN